jgi:hypothetical protein
MDDDAARHISREGLAALGAERPSPRAGRRRTSAMIERRLRDGAGRAMLEA